MNDKEYNRKKKKILNASRELIRMRGVKGWNMDNIAAVCGMSKKTMYKIIMNKENMITELYAREVMDNLKNIRRIIENENDKRKALERIAEEIPANIGAFVYKYANEMSMEFPNVNKNVNEYLEEERKALINFFAECYGEKIFKEDFPPDFIVDLTKKIIDTYAYKEYSESEFVRKCSLALKAVFFGIVKD